MVITCPSCSARYRLNPEKIKGRGAKITCPKCSHVFVVFSDGRAEDASPPEADNFRKNAATTTGAFKAVGISESGASKVASSDDDAAGRSGEVRVVAPGPRNTRRAIRTIQATASVTNLAGGAASVPAAAAPTPPPSASQPPASKPTRASDLDFREVGISNWKVKVSIGLVYDFSDISTLKKYLADKKVTPDDLISHNGKDWSKIGDIDDLDAHFIEVWTRAKAAADSGEVPEDLKQKKKKFEPNPALGGPSDEISKTVRDAMIQTGSLAANPGLSTGSRTALKTGSHRAVTGTHRSRSSAPPAESSGSNRMVLFLVAGLLFVGGSWFALDKLVNGGAPPPGTNAAGESVTVELSAGEKEKIQAEIRRKIEEERQKKIAEIQDSESQTPEDGGEESLESRRSRLVAVAPGQRTTQVVRQPVNQPTAPQQRYEAPKYNGGSAAPTPAASSGATTERAAKDPSLMYLSAGKKKLAAGDYGSAIQMLNQAVSKNPSCGACFEALYEAHKAKGNPDEAARALDKARSLGVSVKASQNSAG